MIKGIGIDLIEIDRFKKVIQRQGKKFLERVFTPAEIKYCLKHKGVTARLTPLKRGNYGELSRLGNSYQHFAVRFAAKEAFLKAIGTGWGTKNSPQWTEIEVNPVRDRSSRFSGSDRDLGINSSYPDIQSEKEYVVDFSNGRKNISNGVKKLPGKPPEIILKGKALQHLRRLKAKRVHLSLTHTQNYASAIIVIS